jgi:hypothetical protein
VFGIALELMFPNSDDPPASAPKGTKIPEIASPVSGNLLFPSFRQFQAPRGKPPSMPEIPVYEYRDL